MKKFCTACFRKRPISEFPYRSDKPDKRVSNCKDCRLKSGRKHYANNKEAIAKRHRAYKWKVITAVQELKEETPCADCKTYYPYYVMDFDHREGETKSFLVSKMVGNGGLERIQEEINKCDIVCSNCHRIRTHKRRASDDTDDC